MRPDLSAIALAIKDAVTVRALEWEPDGDWPTPCLIIPMPELEQVTFGEDGLWKLTYELKLAVSSAWDRSAHVKLGELLPQTKLELQADQTLGGTACGSFVQITVPDDELRAREEEDPYFGAVLSMEVHT